MNIETPGMNGLIPREKTETGNCRNALQELSSRTQVSAWLRARTLTWVTEDSLEQ